MPSRLAWRHAFSKASTELASPSRGEQHENSAAGVDSCIVAVPTAWCPESVAARHDLFRASYRSFLGNFFSDRTRRLWRWDHFGPAPASTAACRSRNDLTQLSYGDRSGAIFQFHSHHGRCFGQRCQLEFDGTGQADERDDYECHL